MKTEYLASGDNKEPRPSIWRRRLTLLGAVSFLMLPLYAHSQDASDDTEDDVFNLDPFSVTAESTEGYTATTAMTGTKIGTLIKNTPLNVQVMTSEFLEDTGMTEFSEIVNYSSSFSGDAVNGINFNSTLNEGRTGPQSLAPGQGNNEATGGRVGLNYSNGIRLRAFPISNVLRNGLPRAGNHSLKAVDRIEVVKGPVAIFFGQSTPGGAINYTTKRPLPRQAATVTTQAGSYGHRSVDVDLNQPIFDSLGVRVFASRKESDGWHNFERNDEDYLGGVIKWDPTPRLTIIVEGEKIDRFTIPSGSPVLTAPLYHNDYFNPPDEILYLSQDSEYGRNGWNRGRGREATLEAWQTAIREDRDVWMRARFFAFPDEGYPLQVSQYGVAGAEIYDSNRDYYDNAVADVFGPDGNLNGPDAFFKAESEVSYYEVSYRPFDWLAIKAMGNYGTQDQRFRLLPANMPFADLTFAGTRLNVGRTEERFTNHLMDMVFSFDFLGISNKLILGGESRFLQRLRRYPLPRWTAELSADYRFWDPVTTFYVPLEQLLPTKPAPAPWDPDLILDPVWEDLGASRFGGELNRTERLGAYAMHQGTLLNGRLHTMMGIRHENQTGERAWKSSLESVGWEDQGTSSGTSFSYGAVYEVIENFNVYASYNQNYQPNSGNKVRAGDPGDFNSSDLAERGLLDDETGTGIDLGVKFEILDKRLNGQISLFQIEREGIARLDWARSRQRMLDEGWNDDSLRVQYWTNGGLERAKGIELELMGQPTPEWQIVFQFTHYFEAAVISDPSLQDFQAERIIDNGLPNVSEDRISVWTNYNFADGRLGGLSVGGGLRYSSDSSPTAYSWTQDIVNDAYLVFDARIGYKWKTNYGDLSLILNIKNVTDELYSEGGVGYSPPRTTLLTLKYQY